MPALSSLVRESFGDVDIYLLDQFARGRFDGVRAVLDAGCGDGRNLVYLLRSGVICFGVDRDAGAVAAVQRLAARLTPDLPPSNFVTAGLEALPWPDASMDAVICSAVLHFAADEAHARVVLDELWRVLKPGGVFFARLASTIGLAALRGVPAGQRVRLPDGTDRFVVDEAWLLAETSRLGATLLDPIKTTNVQEQRAMTTWVLGKPDARLAG